MAEEVIELSIEETNKLRADLGLKPLRTESNENGGSGDVSGLTPTMAAGSGSNEEVLQMSVDETNKLREKLGLPPLRQSDDGGSADVGRKKDVHKPAENVAERDQAAKRVELARLKREVEQGASTVFGSSTLTADDEGKTESWAEKMRRQKGQKKSKKKRKVDDTADQGKDGNKSSKTTKYDEDDLEGMAVRNNMSSIEAGSSTILTLADAEILETSVTAANKIVGLNEHEDELENVNLTEQDKQQDGLRKKRMLEMGMGRAGGYAGFDDEEFEELGGTLGPSREQRGATGTLSGDFEGDESAKPKRTGGFRIGLESGSAKDQMTDFDKALSGKEISLETSGDVAASDYMTIEEEEAEREKKKSKKDAKFKKKKKEKKKKDRRRRRTEMDDDEDEDESGGLNLATTATRNGGGSVLSQLEKTAKSEESSVLRKRRNLNDEEETNGNVEMSIATKPSESTSKRTQYEKAMEKGNLRTREAFSTTAQTKKAQSSYADEEVDDSFLNAAISKARRLNRLRGMNKGASGANAVAEAVKSAALHETSDSKAKSSSKISFSIDDTREFSRALRARVQQKEREVSKAKAKDDEQITSSSNAQTKVDTADMPDAKDIKVEDASDTEMDDVNMEDLAKQVDDTDDNPSVFEGSTAANAGVGRGLSSFLSMLKTTGEVTGKHGGREELRGRAKDERNYDNYQPLDLSKVVSIGKNATDKDIEFANREIKLEYRDKDGRLLTQKEAYRDLCYQFHGHGASKKKEEKRQQQIAREQAESRLASRQLSAARDGDTTGTTLGALKATQKATGKAFIVHKT